MAWATPVSEDVEPVVGSSTLIIVYVALALGSSFCILARSTLLATAGFKTATLLFNKMHFCLFRAPMSQAKRILRVLRPPSFIGIVVVTRRHGSYNPSKPGASFSATRLHAPAQCRKMMKLDSSTDTAPFVAMALVEIGEVGMITLGKAAMSSGMSNFVYVVYYNALGTFILLHYFIYNTYRSKGPVLTFSLLCRFFMLGVLGICLVQIFAITGIKYSSPTLASAMGNLIPGITFLLAVFFRMEKVAIRSRSSQVKILGTVVSIAGAFIVSLYKGPPLLGFSSPSNSNIQLPVSEYSNWALGGLLLTVTCFSSATWKIFQAAVLKEYPDKINLVFFSCFFGTIQCAVVSIIVERNPSAWKLQPGIQRTAVIYAAIVGTVIRSSIIAWCLQKKGPVFVALFKPLGTAIAVFMAVMFLGETPHLGSLIGTVVIAFGFYAVIWAQGKESNMTTGNVGSLESLNQKIPPLKNT